MYDCVIDSYAFPRGCLAISHLSSVDDIILFTFGFSKNLQNLMQFLRDYEHFSGQLINVSKSSFYIPKYCPTHRLHNIHRIIGFQKNDFPFTYLGCPICSSWKRISFFQDLIQKIRSQISGCQSKLLSMGGPVDSH